MSAEKKGKRHWICGPVFVWYGKLQHLHVKYCILEIWIITEVEFGNGVANFYTTCYIFLRNLLHDYMIRSLLLRDTVTALQHKTEALQKPWLSTNTYYSMTYCCRVGETN